MSPIVRLGVWIFSRQTASSLFHADAECKREGYLLVS